MKLSEALEQKQNHIKLLRLGAALLVLWAHCYPLRFGPGIKDPIKVATDGVLSPAGFAVMAFFFWSGLLLAQSWSFDPHPWRYLARRAARIFPGLWLNLLIVVPLLGWWFSSLSFDSFLHHPQTWRYTIGHALLCDTRIATLPGVFATNPMALTNGSLWTLPWEFGCYVLLLGVSFFSLRQPAARRLGIWLLVMGFLIGCFLRWKHLVGIMNYLPIVPTEVAGIDSVRIFVLGVVCWHLRKHIPLNWGICALVIALCTTGVWVEGLHRLWKELAFYPILCFSFLPIKGIDVWNRFGDYSYGTYLYAFPITQVLVQMFPDIGIHTLIAAVAGLSVFCGILSWHALESRCIALAKRRTAGARNRAPAPEPVPVMAGTS